MKLKYSSILVLLLFISTVAKAVDLNSKDRDPKYVESIVARSQKIVDK